MTSLAWFCALVMMNCTPEENSAFNGIEEYCMAQETLSVLHQCRLTDPSDEYTRYYLLGKQEAFKEIAEFIGQAKRDSSYLKRESAERTDAEEVIAISIPVEEIENAPPVHSVFEDIPQASIFSGGAIFTEEKGCECCMWTP